jgi:multidrug efflux pump subunit AcrB
MKEKKEINFKKNWAARIAEIFLRSHHLSLLAIFVIFVSGIVGFIVMPKEYNPDITAPAFVITTDFPDASAQDVYNLVTRPMEEKLREIPQVDQIASQSLAGGESIVNVRFLVGSDEQAAKVDLNQKLADNMALKPAGATNPLVQSVTPDDVPIYTLSLTSDQDSPSTLRASAQDIADQLKTVPGVAGIDIIGGEINNLQVELDAQKLAAQKISINDVVQAIQGSDLGFASYQLSDPAGNTTVNVADYIAGPAQISRLILKQSGGETVRLGDVATVNYGPGDLTDYVSVRNNGQSQKPAVFLAVTKLKGTNIMTVAGALDQKTKALENQPAFSDIHTNVADNEGTVTSREIGNLTEDLVESILIVGLTLLLLLGLRSAAIVSVSIPLVLLAVFAVGAAAGETLNRITLFALILSLGLLVDDAIVVVENIARYLRNNPAKNKNEKIGVVVQAVGEVGTALSMSTLTMILAFLPMAFVTGMMGPYMRPIPFFVPVALSTSLFFAVTLNPFLAFHFIPAGQKEKETFLVRGFKKIIDRYGNYLQKLLDNQKKRRRVLIGISALVVISLSLPFFKLVLFRMLPKADRDQFYVYLNLPANANIAQTETQADQVEKIILSDPQVSQTENYVGAAPVVDFNGLFRGVSERNQENQATLKVVLAPTGTRRQTSEQIASETRAKLDAYVRENPNDKVKIVEDPPGPPVMATLYLKVEGPDDQTRETMTDNLKTIVGHLAGTVDIDTSLADQTADYNFQIDTEKAQRLGLAPAQIAGYLQAALGGVPAGLYHSATGDAFRKPEQESIYVRLAPNDRRNWNDFSQIAIPTAQGSVPLSELLVQNNNYIQKRILSDDGRESEYVSAEMSGRSVVYAMLDLFSAVRKTTLAPNLKLTGVTPYEMTFTAASGDQYHVLLDGEWKLTLDVFRDLGIVMLIVAFLIYSVLTLQTNSFGTSLLIMSSVPLSLIGILPGFAVLNFLKGTFFSATSMIGVIALAGLSVKNAIIYLEYVEPLLKEGYSLKEALVKAGKIRLLPITLTSLTAILGSLTIITDPVWEGLAWAIIFGLTASTVLTMIVFPVTYYMYRIHPRTNRSGSNNTKVVQD